MNSKLLAALVLVAVLPMGCSAPSTPRAAAPPDGGTSPAAAQPAGGSASGVARPAEPGTARAAPPDRQAMKAGYSPFVSYGPLFVALERGYFAEQGIDLDFVAFDASGLMIPPLSAGQLDIASGVPGPALFNALARGVDLKLL